MPGGRGVSTHRAAYELVVGPIPEGLVIDHTCHNRDATCAGGICIHHRCINPNHLEAVTQSENRLRSPHTKVTWGGRLTHCRQGHDFTPENTVIRKGGRVCRSCHRERSRKSMAKRRAEKKGLAGPAAATAEE
ncbi:HNH endonuclease signature motif containing protein [Streptomyces poriferorum]|uniref:HNH endonuclease signature motif containing protein n=1 Tax=Streptomyces poriferorum TaxID=2798799 RepID=UPI0035323D16